VLAIILLHRFQASVPQAEETRCLPQWKAIVEIFKCDSSRLTKTARSVLQVHIVRETESALAVVETFIVNRDSMSVVGAVFQRELIARPHVSNEPQKKWRPNLRWASWY